MINIGGNPFMILLAITAVLGGIGLYFVRNLRPELARDHDIFFSAIAVVYGIILLAFNFRMEITTQLAQVLVVGFAGWFAVESLILRQSLANQARRSPRNPINDFDDVPIGSDYRVEIDPTRGMPETREPRARRMRGTGPTELQGDIDSDTRSRRTRRTPESGEGIIEINEDDISPIIPKRRPRPRTEESSSPRRRRPSSRPTAVEDDRDSL
ncbi:MAG: hypothetical protein HC919_09255 [Oscillatoriales cyanobacterium SM2_2_1]|nr:hypothetical protein [Oscillatoriales cyanobacterium SM2_2_1]